MIIASNLTKTFGKLKALDDVSISCNRGETVALIGPNGCGKTTLIKCILGMVVPDSGFITFNDKNIVHDWLYRKDLGYMPQIGRYPENMTIGQVIDMIKDIRKRNNKNLDEDLIESFQLKDIFRKRVGTLSRGTKQKVSASLALLFDSDVLILDEPTAGLDPLSAEIFKEKLQAEKQKGKLIVITSHILSDLDELVTHVIYMQEGRLLFHKDLETLCTETGEQGLAKAIACVMRNRGK